MHPLLPVGVISINFRRSGVIFTKKKKEEEEKKRKELVRFYSLSSERDFTVKS
jgi:hypothetical protein